MTDRVPAHEVKTRLPRLLDEVERDQSITKTKHGRAVARLVPVKSEAERPAAVTSRSAP